MVLVIEGARFLTFVFLLIQTAVLHGSKTAQAITYTILCGICRQYEKIVRRNQWFTNENNMLERRKTFPLSQEAGSQADSFVHHV